MKILTTQNMQKDQKLVTKWILIFFIISTTSCNAQKDHNAYNFLNKVIEITKHSNDSVYQLHQRNESGKDFFKKYYEFRTNNKPFYTKVEYDSVNDIIGYDTLQLKQNIVKWKSKYRVLDSTFSEKDINLIIETDIKNTKWDNKNSVFNNKKLSIKWCESDYCKNFISKPYYNDKKNHAFVIHSIKGVNRTIYIFKKEGSNWSIIDKINDVGW